MTDKHLLYWVFLINGWNSETQLLNCVGEEHFKEAGAPAWVWPAFKAARDEAEELWNAKLKGA